RAERGADGRRREAAGDVGSGARAAGADVGGALPEVPADGEGGGPSAREAEGCVDRDRRRASGIRGAFRFLARYRAERRGGPRLASFREPGAAFLGGSGERSAPRLV